MITEMQPRAGIARLIRDEMRATSLVYEHLITGAGIGVAEAWIDALAWGRGEQQWGLKRGWYLYATPGSERIAKRSHPRPEDHVLAFGLREWNATKARHNASGLRERYARED